MQNILYYYYLFLQIFLLDVHSVSMLKLASRVSQKRNGIYFGLGTFIFSFSLFQLNNAQIRGNLL